MIFDFEESWAQKMHPSQSHASHMCSSGQGDKTNMWATLVTAPKTLWGGFLSEILLQYWLFRSKSNTCSSRLCSQDTDFIKCIYSLRYCEWCPLIKGSLYTSSPMPSSLRDGHHRGDSTNGEHGSERRVAGWRLPKVKSFNSAGQKICLCVCVPSATSHVLQSFVS